MKSWRPITAKSYDSYIRCWKHYVDKNKIKTASHRGVANLLEELFKTGASHSTVNLARRAVSTYLNRSGNYYYHQVGSHPVICRLVKGVFKSRPFLPRYAETWDVDSVTDHLASWLDIENLSLKQLTWRTLVCWPSCQVKEGNLCIHVHFWGRISSSTETHVWLCTLQC